MPHLPCRRTAPGRALPATCSPDLELMPSRQTHPQEAAHRCLVPPVVAPREVAARARVVHADHPFGAGAPRVPTEVRHDRRGQVDARVPGPTEAEA